MGARVTFVTQNPDAIGRMSCNPAIGGIGKGQIVREIDALGGRMGFLADRAGIQFKVLNRRKGPAVQSSRCQCDRRLYQTSAQEDIGLTDGIEIVADHLCSMRIVGGRITAAVGESGQIYDCHALVLAAGTFLEAITHTGSVIKPEGRYGEPPSKGLSGQLRGLGFEVGRLKTGTPPRLDGRTIDYTLCTIQPGDEPPVGFSRRHPLPIANSESCWLTYTTPETHAVIGDNIAQSPLFNGQITGIGPRYCPSIEDKVVKFAEKERHQLFLEPEGLGNCEIYINGFSTSLPAEVQLAALRTVPALRQVEMTRPGYAVEYDYFPPTQLYGTLETKLIRGLFFAGQINGTSGYEEAAGQGLIAGVNAVLLARGVDPFVPTRAEAYIGVMIDDLVTVGVDEPYRMFTSRAEHRLHLREDNAQERLVEHGHRIGLIDGEERDRVLQRAELVRRRASELAVAFVPGANIPFEGLKRQGGASAHDLLRIPGVTIRDLARFGATIDPIEDDIAESVELMVKYGGYVERQQRLIERFRRMEDERIPAAFDYSHLRGLRHEAMEKFQRIRPGTLGQASRIPGITSADVSLLMIHLNASRRRKPVTAG
jgi:tRNA uridine 5-carboxymethylaminomethyl modification enzyme